MGKSMRSIFGELHVGTGQRLHADIPVASKTISNSFPADRYFTINQIQCKSIVRMISNQIKLGINYIKDFRNNNNQMSSFGISYLNETQMIARIRHFAHKIFEESPQKQMQFNAEHTFGKRKSIYQHAIINTPENSKTKAFINEYSTAPSHKQYQHPSKSRKKRIFQPFQSNSMKKINAIKSPTYKKEEGHIKQRQQIIKQKEEVLKQKGYGLQIKEFSPNKFEPFSGRIHKSIYNRLKTQTDAKNVHRQRTNISPQKKESLWQSFIDRQRRWLVEKQNANLIKQMQHEQERQHQIQEEIGEQPNKSRLKKSKNPLQIYNEHRNIDQHNINQAQLPPNIVYRQPQHMMHSNKVSVQYCINRLKVQTEKLRAKILGNEEIRGLDLPAKRTGTGTGIGTGTCTAPASSPVPDKKLVKSFRK